MNFNFTRIKSIGSVLISIILGGFIALYGHLISSSPGWRRFLEMIDLRNILSLGNVFLFIILVGIIYIIWSLIEQKKN